MTTEELLKPRYKVISDYPGNGLEVGTTMVPANVWQDFTVKFWCEANNNFPHLFRPMHWAEDRKVEDMPEYVMVTREECVKDTGLYCKVFKWSVFDDKILSAVGQFGAELEGYRPLYLSRTELNFPGQVYGRLNACNLLPATKEEYEAYLQTINQLKDGQ